MHNVHWFLHYKCIFFFLFFSCNCSLCYSLTFDNNLLTSFLQDPKVSYHRISCSSSPPQYPSMSLAYLWKHCHQFMFILSLTSAQTTAHSLVHCSKHISNSSHSFNITLTHWSSLLISFLSTHFYIYFFIIFPRLFIGFVACIFINVG